MEHTPATEERIMQICATQGAKRLQEMGISIENLLRSGARIDSMSLADTESMSLVILETTSEILEGTRKYLVTTKIRIDDKNFFGGCDAVAIERTFEYFELKQIEPPRRGLSRLFQKRKPIEQTWVHVSTGLPFIINLGNTLPNNRVEKLMLQDKLPHEWDLGIAPFDPLDQGLNSNMISFAGGLLVLFPQLDRGFVQSPFSEERATPSILEWGLNTGTHPETRYKVSDQFSLHRPELAKVLATEAQRLGDWLPDDIKILGMLIFRSIPKDPGWFGGYTMMHIQRNFHWIASRPIDVHATVQAVFNVLLNEQTGTPSRYPVDFGEMFVYEDEPPVQEPPITGKEFTSKSRI